MILVWTKFSYKIGCSLRLQFSLKKIKIITYFDNLIVGLHVLYVLNTHVKFYTNQILFTLCLYFIHNFKLQKLAI